MRRRAALIAIPVVLVAAVGGLLLWHGAWRGRLGPATVRAAFFGPKVVAITVDDGPSRTYTPQVLALLKARHATATFFVVGQQVVLYPDLVRDELAQGHSVGTHTWSHPRMDTLTPEQSRVEVLRGASTLEAITGRRPLMFRPPRGVLSGAEQAAADSIGTRVVFWDQSLDHAADRSAREAADRVMARLMPGDIVLLHDGPGDHTRDIEALGLLLDDLAARGYHVVPIGQLSL